MVFSIFVSKTIQFLLLYCFLTGFLDLSHADPPYNICSNITNYAPNSPFQYNLNGLLNLLSSNASLSKLYNTSFGDDPYRVYGQFLCLNYNTNASCNDCISTATQDIQKLCPDTNEAVVWEEVCQLRYSNESFMRPLDVTGNIPLYNTMNYSNPEPFKSVVNETLANLMKQAAYNTSNSITSSMYYATREAAITDVDTLYALVQCTSDLSPNDCNRCLQDAITDILISYFYRGARLLSRSCYLRYELYAFYKGETDDHDQGESGQKKMRTIIVIAVVLACLLVAIVGCCVYRLAVRNRTKRGKNEIVIQQSHLHGDGDQYNTYRHHHNFQGRHKLKSSQELPFFDLKTILGATDNFSDSNKIGQGGYGPVYKGVLSDGKEVAVKKLSSNSEQGSDEFTNEVLLIMKLQHKNLVRLLGFCIEQEGKILVYEYMPNSSLDAWLFDPWKRAQLDWSRRLNIINGIARGILYLHEDSRLRIIHRDLKASNVLLDHELNPKISDFGMARIFGGSQGQANTVTIVGTYGYMAPEYAMEGLYSIKSDVFSFGVLLLEIITGSRNAGFHKSKHAPSLLVYAWQLWNEGKGLEVMDPLLINSCRSDEFLRCIHIGLLCVQEDAFDRPTMSSVVVMLKTEAVTPTQPGRPAFSVGRFTDHDSANNCSVNGMTVSDIMPP